jgi:carbamoyltransferase
MAYSEEERFVRNKHAVGLFPTQAVRYGLKEAGLKLSDIDSVVFPWDAERFDKGIIARNFEIFNRTANVDDGLIGWQRSLAKMFTSRLHNAGWSLPALSSRRGHSAAKSRDGRPWGSG